MNEPQHKPIFFDESRRRWQVISPLLITLTVLCGIAALVFLVSIARNPHLPTLTLSQTDLSQMSPSDAHPVAHPAHVGTDTRKRAELRYVLKRNAGIQDAKKKLNAAIARDNAVQPIPAASIAPGHVAGPVRAAFYVNWDKPSLDSLQQHIGQITHLMPVWLLLSPDGAHVRRIKADGIPVTLGTQDGDPGLDNGKTLVSGYDTVAVTEARQHGVAILPLIQNFGNNDFQQDWLHRMLSSPARRSMVIADLLHFVTSSHYQGINVDFETDRADDQTGLTTFMAQLAAVFHPRGLLVTQDIPTDSSVYNLPTLARINDFLVPMLYDQHSSGDPSGPVAGQGWYQQELKGFLAQVPADKLVLGLGTYGYDWAGKNVNSDEISFARAAEIAQESGADMTIDPQSLNPTLAYEDGDTPHRIWMEDATTTLNQMRLALPAHTLGAAVWRLGTEDPSVWSFFGKENNAGLQTFDAHQLGLVSYGTQFGTQFEGEGDALDVAQPPTPGQRAIRIDTKTGLVTGEKFLAYPSQWVIRRQGLVNQTTGENDLPNGTAKGYIALTFDDGPDPRWTPQILNILHQYHVPATFFLVGENAQSHPGLVAREWNEGMEIGNHSFTHPEMDNISPMRTKLELDATQRVIEAITGHMTMLFRSPNRADSEPSTPADLDPILEAQKLGYLFIGESDDPTDWQPGITAPQIISHALADAHKGNCILLHDAGGQTRAETIKALPMIIATLQARGYKFVTVSQMLGRSKAQVFPEVTGRQRWTVMLDRLVFNTTYFLGIGFALVFLVAIGLGIARILFMGTLAVIQARRVQHRVFDASFAPPVSVVIAAYNEAKVINKTIATLLASDYPDLEIVVVDDGSKDDTAGVVHAEYGDNPRVTVMTKPNGGKASALNVGIKACRGEIVVALDADTVFPPDTVGNLVRHFVDPKIGAVSGNVKVGNRDNPLTIWQAVEYITSQNFDRRAFDLLNCITVVPGAIGAWRKDAMILAGLYSSQTLAEDTDLTFKVRKLGYRIVTDNDALAYTEAPDTLRNLAKQRFRWAFGTLQCLWKHRDAFMNRRYGAFGTVALPSLWIYQIGFQALAPIVDLAILWTAFYGLVIAPTLGHQDMLMLLGYWALFSMVELAGAALAFNLDREDKRLLGWLLLQRLVYRQLMYYVIVKSLIVAVRGTLVGWGKFERRGTVRQPDAAPTVATLPSGVIKLAAPPVPSEDSALEPNTPEAMEAK